MAYGNFAANIFRQWLGVERADARSGAAKYCLSYFGRPYGGRSGVLWKHACPDSEFGPAGAGGRAVRQLLCGFAAVQSEQVGDLHRMRAAYDIDVAAAYAHAAVGAVVFGAVEGARLLQRRVPESASR